MQNLFPPDNTSFNETPKNIAPTEPSVWSQISQKLLLILSEEDYIRAIKPLKTTTISQGEIVLSVPDMVLYQEIMDRFLDKIDFCKESLDLNVTIRFEIGTVESPPPVSPVVSPPTGIPKEPSPAGAPNYAGEHGQNMIVSRALTHVSHLNDEYKFSSFVNGPSNQFAHASCLAVADNPGQTYNPLFLYGSTGLGKTHLLHAVGNKVLETKKDPVVTYISSERFMNEMIYCLRFNKMWDFRNKYRHCDVLLVDDIQFISGKERTQEEFFHTFNALYEMKKQIVVTSDVFPQDIPDIEDRLRNRFQWGLIADIQPPDIEHRVAILMTKSEKQGVKLDDSVAQYIATTTKGSIRVLEGALRRVVAFATLQGRPLDTQLASEILQNVLGEAPKQLTIETVQKLVAEHYKVRVADLKSKKRQRAFALPRQIAMYLARTRTNASFPEIGSKFGGKDHTTVMHAVKKIKADRSKDLDLKAGIESLERKMDQQM